MRAYERLINYARVHTASVENADTVPSTARQFDLARLLVQEMTELGISDVYLDEHCYVYGRLPATPGLEDVPCVGFLAHLDTIPDFSGENVRPQVIEDYDGDDIPLGDSGRVLSPRNFPHLRDLTGSTLVVTDGTTVLGADDKAGVAEIMTAAERLLSEHIPHGPIAIGFCPDEEIGHGASLLDLDRFGASLAYTLDGGGTGEIEYENFNAAAAEVRFKGFNVHPGSAKGKMINAMLVAMEANSLLPQDEVPSLTEGRQGFYHLTEARGNVSEARLQYILRDHDAGLFAQRKQKMMDITETLNRKYGKGTVTCELRDQYRNMAEVIAGHPETVRIACQAITEAGLEPVSHPVRGGTDGAQLSFRGLPCPNLGTGGYAYHGLYEHAVAEEMDLCVQIVLNIVKGYARLRK